MIPAVYNFNDRYKGDTSCKVVFEVTKTEDELTTPIDLTNVAIKMHIRLKRGAKCYKVFEIGSGITVTDDNNGVFQLDSFIVDLSANKYVYDIQLTFPDGTVSTYLLGFFNVIEDITE